MRDFIYIYESAQCMAIIIYSFSGLYNKTHTQSVYNVTFKKFNFG